MACSALFISLLPLRDQGIKTLLLELIYFASYKKYFILSLFHKKQRFFSVFLREAEDESVVLVFGVKGWWGAGEEACSGLWTACSFYGILFWVSSLSVCLHFMLFALERLKVCETSPDSAYKNS